MLPVPVSVVARHSSWIHPKDASMPSWKWSSAGGVDLGQVREGYSLEEMGQVRRLRNSGKEVYTVNSLLRAACFLASALNRFFIFWTCDLHCRLSLVPTTVAISSYVQLALVRAKSRRLHSALDHKPINGVNLIATVE